MTQSSPTFTARHIFHPKYTSWVENIPITRSEGASENDVKGTSCVENIPITCAEGMLLKVRHGGGEGKG